MTPAERIAALLAKRFPELAPYEHAMARHPTYRRAVADAIAAAGNEDAIVAKVVAQGQSLHGIRNPPGAVVRRLQQVAALVGTRRHLVDRATYERHALGLRDPELIDDRPWHEALAVAKAADRSCAEREPALIGRKPVDDGVDWDALGAYG
ncbi:MAG TPA: hypothetical protein VKR78_02930 [Acidimicrobiales bacterium]|nr:hypothetical protein [Acidimicrobiales bacterium]